MTPPASSAADMNPYIHSTPIPNSAATLGARMLKL
jgi:hypothetical protein